MGYKLTSQQIGAMALICTTFPSLAPTQERLSDTGSL